MTLGGVVWILGLAVFALTALLVDNRRKLLAMRRGWQSMTKRLMDGQAEALNRMHEAERTLRQAQTKPIVPD